VPRYALLLLPTALLTACPSSQPKAEEKPAPAPVAEAEPKAEAKDEAKDETPEPAPAPAPAESSSGESGESGESSESGEGGESGETGQADAAETRAQADLERAGNLALDLTEALKSNKLENVLALTPFDDREFAKACRGAELPDEREVKARVMHCLRTIKWPSVTDVRVTGGEATGDAASCEGFDAHERVRMLVVAKGGNTQIDLNQPLGKEGQAIAFSGTIVCKAQE
jgi:hypothetical protein